VDNAKSNQQAYLIELGKQDIAIARRDYQTQTEFIFTKLNEIKPVV
jgi:hypothetical protein